MTQNVTKKKLTPTEKRLIEALLDPNNRFKSITEICDTVKCSRPTYYRAFNKPHFRDAYKSRAAALSERHLGQVMNAFVKEATRGSFQHGKVLLEMAGVYAEKTQRDLNLNHQGTVNLKTEPDLSALTDEELESLDAIRQRLYGKGVE